MRGDRHYLGSLERRASVDGLAALSILLKLSIEAGDTEQGQFENLRRSSVPKTMGKSDAPAQKKSTATLRSSSEMKLLAADEIWGSVVLMVF
jgi:hypothetical protein